MIEEEARITAIDGQWAWVETQRRSSCSACSANAGCGVSLLEKTGRERLRQVRALNRANAAVGDPVIVGIAEQALVRGSALVYLIPLIGLFGGAALAEALAPFGKLFGDEGAAILLGICGMAGGLWYLRRQTAGRQDDPRYQPVVLRTRPPLDARPVAMPLSPRPKRPV